MGERNEPPERQIGQSGLTPIGAVGETLVVHEWSGSGPVYMHVHNGDDEAWHVLSGVLRFKFSDGEVDAGPGATVSNETTVSSTNGTGFLAPGALPNSPTPFLRRFHKLSRSFGSQVTT